jgi:hypothetical protein
MIEWLDIEKSGWEYWYTKDSATVYKRDRRMASYRIDTIYENTNIETMIDCIVDIEKLKDWNGDSFETLEVAG